MVGPRRRQHSVSVQDGFNNQPLKKLRRLGTSTNPIVITDDSSGEQEVHVSSKDAAFASFPRKSSKSDARESDTVDQEVPASSATILFYSEEEQDPSTPAFRSLAILSESDFWIEADITAHLELVQGWPAAKRNCLLNVFLEGPGFVITDINGRHYHFVSPGTPDLNAISLGQIRRKLGEVFKIDNLLGIQLEIQQKNAHPNGSTFRNGLCVRPDAAWNDISITDRLSLSQVLAQGGWLRVRLAEYIQLDFANKDYIAVITPSDSATISELRQLAASVSETTPGAVRLRYGGEELDDVDDFGIVQHQGIIRVVIETRECANCLDDAGVSDFPIEATTDTCFHETNICASCLQTWITTSLDNGNWNAITCPAADCGAIMQYTDVQRLASAEDHIRYERLATHSALTAMPNFKWCIKPGCPSGQLHDDHDGTQILLICNACSLQMCSKCDREWHEGETCEAYTERLVAMPGQAAASEAYIAANSRKCPGCQSPIEKASGCDHMSCTRCRRQFCWRCLADYNDIRRHGNTAHNGDCPYYSGNLIDPHAPPRANLDPYRDLAIIQQRARDDNAALQAAAQHLAARNAAAPQAAAPPIAPPAYDWVVNAPPAHFQQGPMPAFGVFPAYPQVAQNAYGHGFPPPRVQQIQYPQPPLQNARLLAGQPPQLGGPGPRAAIAMGHTDVRQLAEFEGRVIEFRQHLAGAQRLGQQQAAGNQRRAQGQAPEDQRHVLEDLRRANTIGRRYDRY